MLFFFYTSSLNVWRGFPHDKNLTAARGGSHHSSITADMPIDHATRTSTRCKTLPDIALPTAWFIADWSAPGNGMNRVGCKACKRNISLYVIVRPLCKSQHPPDCAREAQSVGEAPYVTPPFEAPWSMMAGVMLGS